LNEVGCLSLAWVSGGHDDPIAAVLFALAVILGAAKIAGDLAVRMGQPAVLGELVAGVVIGNLDLVGFDGLQALERDEIVEALARIGVVLLLFEVGLESTVRDMLKVGRPSLLVALLGVAAPFALGWGTGAILLPDRSVYVHAFLGATLTATSVGITARVLKDLGQAQSNEARVILGAAVIDDVLGLVILAVVSSVIGAADAGSSVSVGAVSLLFLKAMAFLFGALAIGLFVSPRLFRFAAHLRGRGVLLATALAFCFVLAWLSSLIGLAAIVGAYAAGLILERVHYRDFATKEEHDLEHLIQPISSFLVPVFFVLMGMRVGLEPFARPEILGLAAVLTLAAIVGKQVCSLGAVGGGLDRLTIGLGMIPRGEVGLIFASIGLGLSINGEPIVDDALYSAVVIMVVITTMATPPALKWSLGRAKRRRVQPASASVERPDG
jgi:Kef-type K+ transport system membrane component KefB